MEATAAMKPWEQHHAVISMPRFAYNPASILQHNAGFLVTCTFRREKSATKEILALIQEGCLQTWEPFGQLGGASELLIRGMIPPTNFWQYMNLAEDGRRNLSGSHGTETREVGKEPAEQALPETGEVPSSQGIPAISCPAEESRMSVQDSKIEQDSTGEEPPSVACEEGKEDCWKLHGGEGDQAVAGLGPADSSYEDIVKTGGNEFTLVKLATMGVIYICASCKPPSTVLSIASRIVKDVQAGTKAVPRWCHRIVPVQATCSMKREELRATVSLLVKDHLRDHLPSSEQPINVVAFNRRGADGARSYSTDSLETTLLGRDECIKIVTSAVEQVTTTVKVDLTYPQMVVSVELIPVAGAQHCLMCAVSVLPGDLMVTKPKINVKPLAPLNPKPKKRKHSR